MVAPNKSSGLYCNRHWNQEAIILSGLLRKSEAVPKFTYVFQFKSEGCCLIEFNSSNFSIKNSWMALI